MVICQHVLIDEKILLNIVNFPLGVFEVHSVLECILNHSTLCTVQLLLRNMPRCKFIEVIQVY